MLDRKQMVAEIANEVVSRLLTELDARRRPPHRRRARGRPARRPARSRPRTGHGVFRTVDEAVAAAADAQVRVAEMGLESAADDRVIRRICDEQADELGRMNSTRPQSAAWSTRSGN